MYSRRTRKQRAVTLLERVARGPSGWNCSLRLEQQEAIGRQYKLWVESWVLPELKDLIPELRRGAA